jgi:acetylornithine deacetylase
MIVSEADLHALTDLATTLLKDLIAIPALSKEEGNRADFLERYLQDKRLNPKRAGHNIICYSTPDPQKPTLLLNSHIDTVKPVASWRRNPFVPEIENDKLYGLGSNDAGASLVTLFATYTYLIDRETPYNLIWLASAEEEISGASGIASMIPHLGSISLAVVGEPTGMQMAIAEKGLMVLDGIATGKAGHAARNEGINAIYLALEDILRIKNYPFDRSSHLLGPTQATVTQIEAGSQHNVVPDQCRYVVDIRSNEHYSNEEIHHLLQAVVSSRLTARSYRLNSSSISEEHPIVIRGRAIGLSTYGSPTLSDQALMPFPSIKIGPGQSSRSHTADEYIELEEIKTGIATYIALLSNLIL